MRAIDVANYLVERWGRDYPATIHKLNRLVYLAQNETVATTGELLPRTASRPGSAVRRCPPSPMRLGSGTTR